MTICRASLTTSTDGASKNWESVRSAMVVMISWQDGHGTHWTRQDNGEPSVGTPSYPPVPLEPFVDHPSRLQRAFRAARGGAKPKSRRDE